MRSRVRIVLAVAALAVGLLPAAPALAACATHNHNTWYNEGSWYSSTWQTKPSGTTCNDINTSWVSHSGSYKAQYYSNGSWVDGSAGWVWHNAGTQSPWKVLITNLIVGAAYKNGQFNSNRQATVKL